MACCLFQLIVVTFGIASHTLRIAVPLLNTLSLLFEHAAIDDVLRDRFVMVISVDGDDAGGMAVIRPLQKE